MYLDVYCCLDRITHLAAITRLEARTFPGGVRKRPGNRATLHPDKLQNRLIIHKVFVDLSCRSPENLIQSR